jgi:hypothetical protein
MHKARIQNLVLTLLAGALTGVFVFGGLTRETPCLLWLVAVIFSFVSGVGFVSILLSDHYYRSRERAWRLRHRKQSRDSLLTR